MWDGAGLARSNAVALVGARTVPDHIGRCHAHHVVLVKEQLHRRIHHARLAHRISERLHLREQAVCPQVLNPLSRVRRRQQLRHALRPIHVDGADALPGFAIAAHDGRGGRAQVARGCEHVATGDGRRRGGQRIDAVKTC